MSSEVPEHREWLTYEEAREICGLSRTTLWRASKKELPYPYRLPVSKIGRAVRIRRDDLRVFMDMQVSRIQCNCAAEDPRIVSLDGEEYSDEEWDEILHWDEDGDSQWEK